AAEAAGEPVRAWHAAWKEIVSAHDALKHYGRGADTFAKAKEFYDRHADKLLPYENVPKAGTTPWIKAAVLTKQIEELTNLGREAKVLVETAERLKGHPDSDQQREYLKSAQAASDKVVAWLAVWENLQKQFAILKRYGAGAADIAKAEGIHAQYADDIVP